MNLVRRLRLLTLWLIADIVAVGFLQAWYDTTHPRNGVQYWLIFIALHVLAYIPLPWIIVTYSEFRKERERRDQ